MRTLAALILLALTASLAIAGPPGLIFHAQFAGDLAASPGPVAQSVHGEPQFMAAPWGKSGILLVKGSYLSYPAQGCLNKSAGTLLFWIQPRWHGNDGKRHAIFSDAAPTHKPIYNSFYLFKTPSSTLQFCVGGVAEHALSTTVADWAPEEWHHVAVSWGSASGIALYVDGARAGEKHCEDEPEQGPTFSIGADYDGSLTAEAGFADVQIFNRIMRPDQIAAIARNLPLEIAGIIDITAPAAAATGQPITIELKAVAAQPLTRPHAVLITLDDIPIASVMPQPPAETWEPGMPIELEPVTVTIPRYLRLPKGHYQLDAILEGTTTSSMMPRPAADVRLYVAGPQLDVPDYVMRDLKVYYQGKPWLSDEPGSGFLYEDRFFWDDEAGRTQAAKLCQSGQIKDALRCVLVDRLEVDIDRALPVYTLKNSPASGASAAPHVLLIQMRSDIPASVGLEVLAAGDESLSDRYLIWAVLNPSSARRSGAAESFIFFPKTEACEVRFTPLAAPAPGAAEPPPVREIAVYRLLDHPSGNVTHLPERRVPRRSFALAPRHTELIYEGFGFDGRDLMQRQYSLRQLLYYMQFVGFDRLQIHAADNSQQSFYDEAILTNAWRWDLFEDIIPLATVAGIGIVPVLPPLSSFDQIFTFRNPDSFQIDANGNVVSDTAGRKCPDPLRPEVQRQLLRFLDEFCDKLVGAVCVPAVGMAVDGSTGTCFATTRPDLPAEKVGYSAFDLLRFEALTGLVVTPGTNNPLEAYNWLRNDPNLWQQWIDFRCRQTHDLWTRCRDLIVSRHPHRYLLVDTNLPVPLAHSDYTTQQLLAHHGYDPQLYRDEKGMRIAANVAAGPVSDTPGEPAYATAAGMEAQLDSTTLGAGREMLHPLLQTLMADNPYCITLRTSLDAKVGHEMMLRGFARAFRALPAVPPQDFDGDIWANRRNIWVRTFGDSIAVINPTRRSQQVRLTLNETLPANTQVIDVTTGERVEMMRGRGRARLILNTDAYDLRTLQIQRPMVRTGGGPINP